MGRFGKLLRKARRDARLGLAAVSARAGVSTMYLADVEAGRRPPPIDARIAELAEAIGIAPDELLGAAAQDRGWVRLGWRPRDRRKERLARELVARWPDMTAAEMEALERALGKGRDK